MKRLLTILFPAVVLGCGPSAAPESSFQALEADLLSARNVSFDFHVTAQGVLEGDLRGRVSASTDGTLSIEAAGSFIGRDLEMSLVTDADSLRMTTSEMADAVSRPEDTFRAVVIGLTRMGIMHNLAQLSTVSPPERSEGGIQEFVTVDGFETVTLEEHEAAAFDLYVQGERTSGVTLAIVDGVPVRRRQVVEFPGGDMIVDERYSSFSIED